MFYNKNVSDVLIESIPFIREFRDKIIVIKYGGSIQDDLELRNNLAQDIMLMYMVGIKPIIVHGGGLKITSILDKFNIDNKFIDGIRVTSMDAIKVVEMVLSGDINKEITFFLNHHGLNAIGISGKDFGFMKAKSIDFDVFGYAGDLVSVDASFLFKLLNDGVIPVVAPIACGDSIDHPGYNVNADVVACEIAKSVKANKVIFLTDMSGVLDKHGNVISTMTPNDADLYKNDGTITGGMIPKIDSCTSCVKNGVNKVHIIDGRVKHSLLIELFTTDGIGTQIISG